MQWFMQLQHIQLAADYHYSTAGKTKQNKFQLTVFKEVSQAWDFSRITETADTNTQTSCRLQMFTKSHM